jgi:beta-glucosidase
MPRAWRKTPACIPRLWPQAHSRGLVDPDTEARIGKLLAGMSLEDKVGQIIQTDISAVVPEDLARYPLGSILAGGNGGPNGDDRATPQAVARALAPLPRGRIGTPPGPRRDPADVRHRRGARSQQHAGAP